MAVYCIGDIQGCNNELLTLLDRLSFDPQRDRLWLTGDLVNRGPDSLEALRFVKSLGDSARVVLGNHDIHLLAVWTGATTLKRRDTLADILEAPDCDELLHWLRRLPLMQEDHELGYVMTHAGLHPAWTLERARQCARELEQVLSGNQYRDLLMQVYGNEPSRWSPTLRGWDRLRFITNALTRMRYCDAEGRMLLDYKGPPGTQPRGYLPWFRVPVRRPVPDGLTPISGHWSTLGFHEQSDLVAIDTGCLWGGQLTAIRLDGPRERVSVNCPGAMEPDPQHDHDEY